MYTSMQVKHTCILESTYLHWPTARSQFTRIISGHLVRNINTLLALIVVSSSRWFTFVSCWIKHSFFLCKYYGGNENMPTVLPIKSIDWCRIDNMHMYLLFLHLRAVNKHSSLLAATVSCGFANFIPRVNFAANSLWLDWMVPAINNGQKNYSDGC